MLVVDDHVLIRKALRIILEGYPDVTVIGEAGNGREAVQAVALLQPTVIVMDIDMPVMNGIEATTRITATHPGTVIVGLSVNIRQEYHAAMVEAGASVLLLKELADTQLYPAIKLALQNRP